MSDYEEGYNDGVYFAKSCLMDDAVEAMRAKCEEITRKYHGALSAINPLSTASLTAQSITRDIAALKAEA
jgi:hypothetical protein